MFSATVYGQKSLHDRAKICFNQLIMADNDFPGQSLLPTYNL